MKAASKMENDVRRCDRDKVAEFFDGYAEGFDSIYGGSAKRSFLNRWIDRVLRQSMYVRFWETVKRIDSSEIQSVLDVGCGSGRYCVEFIRLGKQVTGIDVADGMLDLASKACGVTVDRGTARFIKGDYLAHHFDQQFDAIVLMGLLDYIKDAEALFQKLGKDSMKLILASFPKRRGFLAMQRRLRYAIKGCPLYMYSREDIGKLVACAGARSHEIQETDREFYVSIRL